VHLIEVGQRLVLLREVADGPDRRHQAIHRVDRLEGDHFGRIERHALQVGLEVVQVVVAPDQLAAAAVADMPAIMEAWFLASENRMQPGSSFCRVASVVSLAT
jgi:hypothetical protein